MCGTHREESLNETLWLREVKLSLFLSVMPFEGVLQEESLNIYNGNYVDRQNIQAGLTARWSISYPFIELSNWPSSS
jgi:hypothetical protein